MPFMAASASIEFPTAPALTAAGSTLSRLSRCTPPTSSSGSPGPPTNCVGQRCVPPFSSRGRSRQHEAAHRGTLSPSAGSVPNWHCPRPPNSASQRGHTGHAGGSLKAASDRRLPAQGDGPASPPRLAPPPSMPARNSRLLTGRSRPRRTPEGSLGSGACMETWMCDLSARLDQIGRNLPWCGRVPAAGNGHDRELSPKNEQWNERQRTRADRRNRLRVLHCFGHGALERPSGMEPGLTSALRYRGRRRCRTGRQVPGRDRHRAKPAQAMRPRVSCARSSWIDVGRRRPADGDFRGEMSERDVASPCHHSLFGTKN